MNQRVQQALSESAPDDVVVENEAFVQVLPDLADEKATASWLRSVIPRLDPNTQYCKDLNRALARHEFRQQQAGATHE